MLETKKIEPGSDTHLTLLGAPMHFHLLVGKDRAEMLAFGRTVWEAAAVQAVGADAKDAARYRWLRTPPNNIDGRVYGPTFEKYCGGLLRRGTYLDEAIDAALAVSPIGDGGGKDA